MKPTLWAILPMWIIFFCSVACVTIGAYQHNQRQDRVKACIIATNAASDTDYMFCEWAAELPPITIIAVDACIADGDTVWTVDYVRQGETDTVGVDWLNWEQKEYLTTNF